MPIYFRKRIRTGPFAWLNLSRSGPSVSLTAGGVTVNPRRRRVRVNLPGPFFWMSRRRSR